MVSTPHEPINARLDFLDASTPGKQEIPFYRLFGCMGCSFEGDKTRTLKEGLETWFNGRIFVSPKIYTLNQLGSEEERPELSSRPYQVEEVAVGDARMISQVKFLDGKPHGQEVLLFYSLLESREMPEEEVSRRTRKKE